MLSCGDIYIDEADGAAVRSKAERTRQNQNGSHGWHNYGRKEILMKDAVSISGKKEECFCQIVEHTPGRERPWRKSSGLFYGIDNTWGERPAK